MSRFEHEIGQQSLSKGKTVPAAAQTMIRSAPFAHPPAGDVQGFYERGTARFTGIPYARAERFEAPHPLDRWGDVLVATRPAPACPQNPSPAIENMFHARVEELGFSEDCQNLSITAPEDAAEGDDLPVMVWIHGGSNICGAGDMHGTHPTALVTEQNVVVVNVTYRLGILGYLNIEGHPANRGLLDQAEALRWVRRNIAAFGGNPENITVFGQSAGADAIQHLLSLPESLFDRAILQSPPAGIVLGRESMTAKMLKLGADLNQDTPISDILALEKKILKSVLGYGVKTGMAFGVQHGAEPVPPAAMLPIAWQKKSHVALMVGHTQYETGFFTQTLGIADALQPLGKTGSRIQEKLIESTTRSVYAAGIEEFTRNQQEAGAPVTRYELSWHGSGELGAVHGIDVPLLFEEPGIENLPIIDGATAQEVHRAGVLLRNIWADFARGLDVSTQREEGIISFI